MRAKTKSIRKCMCMEENACIVNESKKNENSEKCMCFEFAILSLIYLIIKHEHVFPHRTKQLCYAGVNGEKRPLPVRSLLVLLFRVHDTRLQRSVHLQRYMASLSAANQRRCTLHLQSMHLLLQEKLK